MKVFGKIRNSHASCGQTDRKGNKILCNKCRRKFNKDLEQLVTIGMAMDNNKEVVVEQKSWLQKVFGW